jgi:hypothetical protein
MNHYILFAGLDEYYYGPIEPYAIEQFPRQIRADTSAREHADTLYSEAAGDGIIQSADDILESDDYDHEDDWDYANDIFWENASDWVVYRTELFDLFNSTHREIARTLGKTELLRQWRRPEEPGLRQDGPKMDLWPECPSASRTATATSIAA